MNLKQNESGLLKVVVKSLSEKNLTLKNGHQLIGSVFCP